MVSKTIIERVKHSFIVIALGAVISVVPFYFQTKAMTEENKNENIQQFELISVHQQRLRELEVKGAVDDTEIKQIKESLERIEKKIDRLIERR